MLAFKTTGLCASPFTGNVRAYKTFRKDFALWCCLVFRCQQCKGMKVFSTEMGNMTLPDDTMVWAAVAQELERSVH